jgi:uncharacterized protein (DUF58 family)
VTPAATELADPEIFLAMDDLELAGSGLADSVWLGRHGSVRRGGGVEFHSHRPYERGDDLRLVNWTLYARQRRLYVRESRQESRRPVYLLVDATGSMSIAHGPWSKFHYAARAAAGLAYLAAWQGDAPALGLLVARLEAPHSARTGTIHAAGICSALAAASPEGEGDVAAAFADARHFCRQRGFIVLLSDFFDKEDVLLGGLAELRAQGHDVLAMQVLDPVEAELPRVGDYDFLCAESGTRLKTSTEPIHAAHLRVVAAWRDRLRVAAHAAGVRWESVTTAEPLAPVLRRWMA